jgi:anaerobic magnesium-protoporphyrin IX monomethyl ester cyclase
MAGTRVLFTHSYFLRYDPKQWETMQPFAPLGTIWAAAYLRQNGYDVRLHDVMFAHGPESLQPVLDRFKPDVLVIYDDGFNYLTKMCLTNMREAAFEMSRMAKANGCKVIVSSSDSTDQYGKYLDNYADYVIIGEAEQTLLELIEMIKSGREPGLDFAGIAYKDNGGIIHTGKRPVLNNLDSLPLPAWNLVNIAEYQAAWKNKHGYFSINIGTTRGCPYKCNWCAKPIYGNRYNARSPENVVEELKMLKETYGFEHVWFCDDIFGLKPGWVKRFAELVKKHKLDFKFKIQSRADLLLKDEQITELAAAGCETVWMGAESGSQKILDAMDKGTTIQQIEDATALLKKHGIRPAYFLQFGYPGETIEDINLTLSLLRRNIPEDIGISVSYPLPGTGFFESVKEQMKAKTNWTDSDELALMFKNTYEPEFYKQLHRYVHAYYRILRTKHFIKTGYSRYKLLIRLPYYNWLVSRERKKLNRIQPLM